MGVRTGICLFAIVIGLLLVGDSVLTPVPLPRKPVQKESEIVRREALRSAFATLSIDHDNQVEQFRNRANTHAGRNHLVMDLFDAERLAYAAGVVAPADEVYVALARGLSGTLPDWSGARVCRVERLAGGTDLIAYVRHPTFPARWWLTTSGDEVRAWDYEDCRVGIRLSELLAASRNPATSSSTARALALLANPESDDWQATLNATEAVPVRVLLRLALAARALDQAQPDVALVQTDLAEAERPGMPAVDLLRFTAFTQRGQADAAAAALARYQAILGPP